MILGSRDRFPTTKFHAWLTLLMMATTSGVAQTPTIPPAADPGALQQRQMEEERRRRELEQGPPKATEPVQGAALETPTSKPSDDQVRFFAKEIQISPSEILPAAELDDMAKELTGREISLADLKQLVKRINDRYRSKNIVTAQATIPPQDVTQGVVRIRLVESHVDRVLIQGNKTTREGYVRNRLGTKPGDLVDLPRLEKAMIRFNRTNDAQLRTELRPGGAFGTTDFLVNVTEPGRHDLRLMVDNFGSYTTGRTRITGAYLNRSLLGFRDEFMISDVEAEGQSSRAISYGFPFNRWGGRIDLAYNDDATKIKNGPLESLKITGSSKAWTISARQPVYFGPRSQVDAILGTRRRESKNWIDSEFLQGTKTRDVNVGLEYQFFTDQDFWLANYTRYSGRYEQVTKESLTVDRGLLRYSHDCRNGLALQGSLSWQSTNDHSLPSSELFFVGGEGSVRGYAVGAYSGDTGYLVNLELRHPIRTWITEKHKVVTTGTLYLDDGRVSPFRPPNSSLPKQEHITGIGWSLNAFIDRSFQARLAYGHAVKSVTKDLEDNALRFQLVYSFF